jgi:hypothetical protein
MAKKVKIKAKEKRQPEKLLVKVPAEYVFYCNDGSVFADLRELAEGLKAMSDETFAYHCNVEKRDFSNWVRYILGDEELANDLAKASSRSDAAECVVTRITLLTGK